MEFHNAKGMNVFVTSLFLIGCQIGGGIVAIPKAIANSYWYGLFVLFLGGLAAAYSAIKLGECWNLIQRRWPESKSSSRKPYAEICSKAFGPRIQHFVSGSVVFSTFGISTIYLLLASESIEHLLKVGGVNSHVCFCHLILILAAILTPPTLLGTPKEFWPVAVLSMATSFVAVICIIAGSILDGIGHSKTSLMTNETKATTEPEYLDHVYPNTTYSQPTFQSLALAYGAMSFAYSGHSAFPTYQQDMKRPRDFWKSVIIAFAAVLLCYIPIGLVGYFVYGDAAQQNIALNIQTKWITICLSSMITIHLVVTFIMSINPPCQEMEELFKVPHDFNWKRVVIRIAVVCCSVFVCETIPSFGLILDLFGATTMSANAYVLPGLSFLALKRKLASTPGPITNDKQASLFYTDNNSAITPPTRLEYILNLGIAALGVIGGIAGTYGALVAIFQHEFAKVCYLGD